MKEEIQKSAILKAIYERRSIRHFLPDADIDPELIIEALKAASWAPSGLNNQPWRFVIVRDPEIKGKLAGLTRYSATIKSATVLIPVFLDRQESYDFTKDCQAVGACIQNMLLALHSFGLGAVWIGEILKNKDRVLEILDVPERMELMAVVAVGYPAHGGQSSHRRPIEELIVHER